MVKFLMLLGNYEETALRSVSEYHCDPGYLLYGNYCYHLESEDVKSWQDAEDHCSRQQGHLASIHSQEELSFLTGEKRSRPTSGRAWVGLNDIKSENQFVYTDGTPADFLPWALGQPDNWQDNEDCVHLRGHNHAQPGLFNDDFCTSTREFICKKGGIFSQSCAPRWIQ
uniref:C-type lectin domain-containing protein n=1 Tax=Oryzias sinensis TaxID=183150 RepID=A0A8C7XNX2_9TELE